MNCRKVVNYSAIDEDLTFNFISTRSLACNKLVRSVKIHELESNFEKIAEYDFTTYALLSCWRLTEVNGSMQVKILEIAPLLRMR